MLPSLREILLGLVIPMVWASLCWGLAAWKPRLRAIAVLGCLSMVGAFAAAFWCNEDPGSFPPRDSIHWLFWGSFGVLALSLGQAVGQSKKLYFHLPFAVGSILLLVILTSTSWRHLPGEEPDTFKWSKMHIAQASAVWIAVAVLVWFGAARVSKISASSGAWVMGLTCAISAAVLGLSGSTSAPYRMASFGLALVPFLVLVLTVRREFELPPAVVTIWATLFSGMLLAGYLYYDLTAANGLLLASAPVAAALVPSGWNRWKATLFRILLAAIPLNIAAVCALIAFRHASENAGGY